ncbi:hypothetical protein AYL44_03630 [Microbacterium oleivorans]|uniref:Uncharacterized protein n=1 Tax=Microbacterium oleivorans TaxID=273677 RepID=A0A177KE72_9MICO|nr:hypothetical protein AYL44_03630 [Microbacterium oleivorans]
MRDAFATYVQNGQGVEFVLMNNERIRAQVADWDTVGVWFINSNHMSFLPWTNISLVHTLPAGTDA